VLADCRYLGQMSAQASLRRRNVSTCLTLPSPQRCAYSVSTLKVEQQGSTLRVLYNDHYRYLREEWRLSE
jgi:hypothetical protein